RMSGRIVLQRRPAPGFQRQAQAVAIPARQGLRVLALEEDAPDAGDAPGRLRLDRGNAEAQPQDKRCASGQLVMGHLAALPISLTAKLAPGATSVHRPPARDD